MVLLKSSACPGQHSNKDTSILSSTMDTEPRINAAVIKSFCPLLRHAGRGEEPLHFLSISLTSSKNWLTSPLKAEKPMRSSAFTTCSGFSVFFLSSSDMVFASDAMS